MATHASSSESTGVQKFNSEALFAERRTLLKATQHECAGALEQTKTLHHKLKGASLDPVSVFPGYLAQMPGANGPAKSEHKNAVATFPIQSCLNVNEKQFADSEAKDYETSRTQQLQVTAGQDCEPAKRTISILSKESICVSVLAVPCRPAQAGITTSTIPARAAAEEISSGIGAGRGNS